MKKQNDFKKCAKQITELLFPRRCPVCDNIVRMGQGLICRSCAGRLAAVKAPFCLKCGKPLAMEETEYCGDCRKKAHLYIRGRALYEYESAAGVIYRFKYSGRQEYADFLGGEMARELEPFIKQIAPDGLVPVPLSRKRFNRRGYNQAGLLAKVVGKKLEIPVYDKLVRRVRDTIPQKELNASARQNNLKKAFKIAGNDVKLSTIILVDDIYTTGSTIDAVTEVLLQSGVKKVYFIALAVGAGI